MIPATFEIILYIPAHHLDRDTLSEEVIAKETNDFHHVDVVLALY
jgi:hypothetical protein